MKVRSLGEHTREDGAFVYKSSRTTTVDRVCPEAASGKTFVPGVTLPEFRARSRSHTHTHWETAISLEPLPERLSEHARAAKTSRHKRRREKSKIPREHSAQEKKRKWEQQAGTERGNCFAAFAGRRWTNLPAKTAWSSLEEEINISGHCLPVRLLEVLGLGIMKFFLFLFSGNGSTFLIARPVRCTVVVPLSFILVLAVEKLRRSVSRDLQLGSCAVGNDMGSLSSPPSSIHKESEREKDKEKEVMRRALAKWNTKYPKRFRENIDVALSVFEAGRSLLTSSFEGCSSSGATKKLRWWKRQQKVDRLHVSKKVRRVWANAAVEGDRFATW